MSERHSSPKNRPEDVASSGPRSRAAERSRSRGGMGRVLEAVQNGLDIARLGGLTEREPSPHIVADSGENHRLRRYFPDALKRGRPPAILVPPLMMTAELWDVDPSTSAVAALHAGGADPWVVDFGSPEREKGGLERDLADHVIAVSDAVAFVREETGRDVHLMGYSQGGMFAYQAAAYRRSEGLASLVTFGSGVDLHAGLPPLPMEFLLDGVEQLSKLQARMMPGGIPRWATQLGFQLMDPIKTVQQRIDFARQLFDRETLQEREGTRRFLNGEGWAAFPGPALRDLMEQLVAENRLLQGGLVIDGVTVTLADITVPILAFVGTTDSIAPPHTVRAITQAAPRAEAYQVKVPAGHFGLVVGSRSSEITWPSVADWLRHWEEDLPLPAAAARLEVREEVQTRRTAADDLRDGARLAFNLGRNVLDGTSRFLETRAGVLGRMASAVVPQLPRLSRLADIRSDTRVSLGQVATERSEESPDETFFLFESRAHSYAAAEARIDNIVLGLLSCGVRHGDHVGLLMDTRPSAVAAAVALSRLGAVTVLLRPDVNLERQLAVAPCDHLLSDPEHAKGARKAFGRDVLVLGGGGGSRTLGAGLIDMEAIDPSRVEPPQWYRKNPGRAGELAIVLITGDGDRIGTSRITNRRWATSAYGTASACALTSRDTVYCCSPTHHATGLLVCVGGALVSGARLAMANQFGPNLDPPLFWDDVRRYGVSVVFYTGSMCAALVNAPDSPAERHHPLRLFAGSGMPKALWERVLDRFHPVRVVEFFASTEGNGVLVNLTGEKVGSLGRPLPGAADLEIAAWDLERGRVAQGPSGFTERCGDDEVGLLVARVDPARGEVEGRPIRGLFEADDAWLSTRDLVRRDRDGDYFLVDQVRDVIHTARGAVPTLRVEEVLEGELAFVDLAAVYGVTLEGVTGEVPFAALTLRPGHEFDAAALLHVIEHHLPRPHRPVLVRILDELPHTAGHRTRKSTLRAQGFGEGEAYWWKPKAHAYQPFHASADDEKALRESLLG